MALQAISNNKHHVNVNVCTSI